MTSILFISPRYYPHVGGLEYVVKSVVDRLAYKGYDVAVLTGDMGPRRDEYINNTRIYRWPVYWDTYGLPRALNKLHDFTEMLCREFDVVHVHGVHNIFPVLALRACRNPKIVLTMHYHGTGHSPLAKLAWPVWRQYVGKAIKRVCVVHAVSSYEAELIKRHFGVDALVIEHGVEEWLKELKWDPADYALYAGRIEKYKRVELLGYVVKLLNEKHGLNLRLKIIGDGKYKEHLIKNLRKINVDFEIEGFKPYRDYIEILRRSVFVANLSEREAFGITINEANAMGVPAVVAEPWGRHFEKRARVVIIDPGKINQSIHVIKSLIQQASSLPRDSVLGWSEVVISYEKLYRSI